METAPTFQQKIYEMLMESQYWPPDQMLAYQRSQLTQLLRHARATVPFYESRLDPVFKKDGTIDWARWDEIPIVTRDDLRDRRNQMVTTALPLGHGPTKTYFSSGSSGTPISIEATALATLANSAAIHRHMTYAGLDVPKSRAQLIDNKEDGDDLKEVFILNDSNDYLLFSKGLADIAINRNLSEIRKLELLKEHGISYLYDNPNSAELLARANLEYSLGVRLDAIFCTGQELTRKQKLLFHESFGALGHIVYSSKEGGMMGFECGNGPNFHINSELVFLETVTPDGIQCVFGQTGRIIVTPFFSSALPLIRYDQGDTAKTIPQCDCHCRLPVLGDISGRQDQMFQLPDGPKSITGIGAAFLTTELNALAYQLAQTAPLAMEVRYIPIDPKLEVATKPIIAHLQRLIHSEMKVTLRPVEKIAPNPGGKLQRYICEIRQ